MRRTAITGRSALVGGGATGIGRAVAEHLARAGHRVMITGRHADVLDAAAKEIHDDTGAEVDALVADVSATDQPPCSRGGRARASTCWSSTRAARRRGGSSQLTDAQWEPRSRCW